MKGKTLLLLMVPVICWLLFNTTANRHMHVLANGFLISHAHPFEKTNPGANAISLNGQNVPAPNDPSGLPLHAHSEKELLLLSLFSEFLFSFIALIIIRPLIRKISGTIGIRLTHPVPAREYYHLHHYHAPPAFS